MAGKVTKSMKVAANGILNIEDEDIFIEVEDKGVFSLKKLLSSFDGLNVKISCTYDKEQDTPEEDIAVNDGTGEVLE